MLDFESEEETDGEKLRDFENPTLGSDSEPGLRKWVDDDCSVGFGKAAIEEVEDQRLKSKAKEKLKNIMFVTVLLFAGCIRGLDNDYVNDVDYIYIFELMTQIIVLQLRKLK